MSDEDLSTIFSGLSLSTERDIFYDSEEGLLVRCKSFCDPDFYGNFEDEEEELVGFYENAEEEEEQLLGWNSFYENVEEEEALVGWKRFYENFEDEEEDELVGCERFYDSEFCKIVGEGEDEEVIEGEVDPVHHSIIKHIAIKNPFLREVTNEGEIKLNYMGQERRIKHYSSSHKILLVGEGDFSFSASLAMAFGSASNMIATSLDSREFLMCHYARAISNINYLTGNGCRVLHGIDATEMAENPLLRGRKFDRIVFNFPFAGFFKTEPRESQLSKHKRLVRLFLKNAKKMINERGEIHITHKTNGFHREWNLEALAYFHGLRLIEAVDFESTDYPGYANKCGFGGDNGFNCNPSQTYKFGHFP